MLKEVQTGKGEETGVMHVDAILNLTNFASGQSLYKSILSFWEEAISIFKLVVK